MALASQDSTSQESQKNLSPALMQLKKKQEKQQKELLEKLEAEEKVRQAELSQTLKLEKKIESAELERLEEEKLQKKRQVELKRLQAEEAAQKAEAEVKEQEFLAAQAVQEAKQAAARRAAARANLARLKRRNELQRTQAEAQLKLLRIKQQNESEAMSDLEKSKTGQTSLASLPPIQSQAQIEAKKQLDKFEAERKAAEDKQREQELEAKREVERRAQLAKQQKEQELKKKQDAELRIAEEKKAEKIKKQQEMEAKRKSVVEDKSQKLNQELDSFSVTLNKKHFQSVIQITNEVREQGFGDLPIRVHTSDVYKKSFTFPQIAHNDYAVEQLEALNIAEQNLDKDPTNDTVMENFINTANEVAQNLTERYKEQWVDPKDDRNTKFAQIDASE